MQGKHTMNEVVMIPVSQLEPHPDALRFWAFDHNSNKQDEDSQAIKASVAADGIKQPLAVIPTADGKSYLVVDGCTRLEGAKEGGIEECPCIIRKGFEDEMDKNMFILNMNRKRFTNSQRIMKFLLDNKCRIMEEREANMDPKKAGSKGGRGKGVQDGQPLSALKISEALGVGRADVMAGIELLICHDEGKIVVIDKAEGMREMHKLINEEDRELLQAIYQSVLDGDTHVRTWLPAFYGKKVDPLTSGRQHINYLKHAGRTFAGLTTIFRDWDEIAKTSQIDIEKVFRNVMETIPEDLFKEIEHIVEERRASSTKAKR